MTTERFRHAALVLFGKDADKPERGWQSRLTQTLGYDRSAFTRWVTSGHIPAPVLLLMEAWYWRFEQTGERPPDYL